MLKETKLYRKAINWIQSKGYHHIRAVGLDDMDDPVSYNREAGDKEMIPDVTARLNGKKSYFEIAQKTTNTRLLVTKWRLLERLAQIKKGTFYILAPHGHKSFANRLVKQYDMNAEVVSI